MGIYILQKDFPNAPAGTELVWNSTETWLGGPYKGGRYIIAEMPSDKSCNIVFTTDDVENNTEWFRKKEVTEKPTYISIKDIDGIPAGAEFIWMNVLGNWFYGHASKLGPDFREMNLPAELVENNHEWFKKKEVEQRSSVNIKVYDFNKTYEGLKDNFYGRGARVVFCETTGHYAPLEEHYPDHCHFLTKSAVELNPSIWRHVPVEINKSWWAKPINEFIMKEMPELDNKQIPDTIAGLTGQKSDFDSLPEYEKSFVSRRLKEIIGRNNKALDDLHTSTMQKMLEMDILFREQKKQQATNEFLNDLVTGTSMQFKDQELEMNRNCEADEILSQHPLCKKEAIIPQWEWRVNRVKEINKFMGSMNFRGISQDMFNEWNEHVDWIRNNIVNAK